MRFEDPTHCPGCVIDMKNIFIEGRRHDNQRVDVFWDLTERTSVTLGGDRKLDFQITHPVDSPFVRGDYSESDERIMNIFETGFGKRHICELARIPGNVGIKPMLEKGKQWVKAGSCGHHCVLRITLMGTVPQGVEGRWEWVGRKRFEMPIPSGLESLLGSKLEVDGWFRANGLRASRRRKPCLEFIEKSKGAWEKHLPNKTSVNLWFDEFLIPSPCPGIILWGAYMEMLEWKGKNVAMPNVLERKSKATGANSTIV